MPPWAGKIKNYYVMFKPLFPRVALILLWSALTVVGVACRQEQKTVKIPQNHTQQSTPSAPPVVDSESFSQKLTPTPKPKSTHNHEETVKPTFFEMGLDKAAGGFSISQSAQSPEDWKLVADYYQDAINRLNYAVKIMLTQFYGQYSELSEPIWVVKQKQLKAKEKNDK